MQFLLFLKEVLIAIVSVKSFCPQNSYFSFSLFAEAKQKKKKKKEKEREINQLGQLKVNPNSGS